MGSMADQLEQLRKAAELAQADILKQMTERLPSQLLRELLMVAEAEEAERIYTHPESPEFHLLNLAMFARIEKEARRRADQSAVYARHLGSSYLQLGKAAGIANGAAYSRWHKKAALGLENEKAGNDPLSAPNVQPVASTEA